MNKTIKFLILAAAVVMICIGIRGLASQGDSRSSDADNSLVNTGNPDKNEQYSSPSLPASELLNVKIPADIPSQVKDYEGFRLSFNKDNKTPNWVAWELLASESDGSSSRSNNFWTDPDIDGCPSKSDYSRSGYDRGHICPSADQKWSRKAMEDCFVMANMCPQDHSLNSGAWSTLEKKERLWAQRDSAILIVGGPIYYPGDNERIGEAGVRVPRAFFKVLAAPFLPDPRGIAFIYPNMSAPGNMENYVMTIDEVEKATGFDFFSSLPDEIENEIESKSSFKEWNKR